MDFTGCEEQEFGGKVKGGENPLISLKGLPKGFDLKKLDGVDVDLKLEDFQTWAREDKLPYSKVPEAMKRRLELYQKVLPRGLLRGLIDAAMLSPAHQPCLREHLDAMDPEDAVKLRCVLQEGSREAKPSVPLGIDL